MTLSQFFSKYNGRHADFDGKYGAQCVDVIRLYLREVLGLDPYTLPPVNYAKEFYTKFNSSKFIRIANTPNGMPKKGDIVVWGFYPLVTGWAGHVAIYQGGNVYTMFSFDQNYPTGSVCHFQSHSYKGVLGWLRKK